MRKGNISSSTRSCSSSNSNSKDPKNPGAPKCGLRRPLEYLSKSLKAFGSFWSPFQDIKAFLNAFGRLLSGLSKGLRGDFHKPWKAFTMAGSESTVCTSLPLQNRHLRYKR